MTRFKSILPFTVLLFLAIVVFTSCKRYNENKKVIVSKIVCDSLFSDNENDIRHVSFGDFRENVSIVDGPTIIENEAERIVEKISLLNSDSTKVEIFYLFKENKLGEMEVNIITNSDSLLLNIAKKVKNKLSKKYGKAIEEGGYVYWNGKSRAGFKVEIYLSNKSGQFHLPTLQIIFRAELVETPRMAFAY